MDVMCESCGETNRSGNEFCAFCGAFMSWSENGQQDGPPRQASTAQRGAAQQEDRRQGREVPPAQAPGQLRERSTTHSPSADTEADTMPLPPPPPPRPAHAQPPGRPAHAPGFDRPEAVGPTAARPAAFRPAEGPIVSGPGVEVSRPCPDCGRTNDAGRRFCAKCGYRLIGTTAARPAQRRQSAWRSWWARHWNGRERSARRAYRRSLPALYRWRRVLIGLVTLGLLGTGLVFTQGRPDRWVVDRWYDLPNTLDRVGPVTPSVKPAAAVVRGSTVWAVTDGTVASLTVKWAPGNLVSCDGRPATGEIVLSFPARRVRAIEVWAGPQTQAERDLELKPERVAYHLGDGPCQHTDLEDTDERQRIKVDSAVPITQVRIRVETVYPGAAGAAQQLRFREVAVMARPE